MSRDRPAVVMLGAHRCFHRRVELQGAAERLGSPCRLACCAEGRSEAVVRLR